MAVANGVGLSKVLMIKNSRLTAFFFKVLLDPNSRAPRTDIPGYTGVESAKQNQGDISRNFPANRWHFSRKKIKNSPGTLCFQGKERVQADSSL